MSGLFFASFFLNIYGIIIGICAIALLAIYGRFRSFKAVGYIILSIFFGLAVAVNLCYTHFVHNKITAYAGENCTFSGEISDYTVYDGGFASYVIDGEINGTQRAKISLFTDEINADFGDILSIESCTLSRFDRDYLFDGEAYNKSRHIYLEAKNASGITVEKSEKRQLKAILSDFRTQQISKLRRLMNDDNGGILAGMIFGETRYIAENTEFNLYRCGVGHILSVSGLHVSIIASILMAILRRIGINKYIRFGLMNLLIILMIIMTGSPISAIRATIMLDMLYSAELFGEQNDSLNSLCIAVLLISMWDCYSIYSSGFILSVCGTFGIAVFAPYMAEKSENTAVKSIISAVCTSIAVMPATMFYFDEISLISPVANILLIPLCTVAMIFGILFVATGGIFEFLLYPADFILTATVKITDISAKIPYTTLSRTADFMPVFVLVSAFLTIVVYLFSGKKKQLITAISVAVVVNLAVSGIYGKIRENRLIIAVLGEGNSVAAVISHKGENIIVDLGGKGNNEEYVAKYLTEKGIHHIDSLLLTENSHSKYASYEKKLKNFSLKEINSCDVEAEEVTIKNPRFTAEYADGVLTITGDSCNISLVTVKSEIYNTSDIYVYYGYISKSAEIIDESIVIDETGNNFEIIPEKSGKYKIRSL